MRMVVTTKLFVANYPDGCTTAELEAYFKKFGTVRECDIVRNGPAFVHYASEDEAKVAQEATNGVDFMGSTLRVEMSRSKVRQKPGMDKEDCCFRCGKTGHWSRDCSKSDSRHSSFASRGSRRSYTDDYGGPPDPYYDRYERDRYPPPPPRDPYDHYRPYPSDPYRRPLPPRDPYADQDPYYGERERDPYARPAPRRDPYDRPAPSRDPYDRPAPSRDPYARPAARGDPYARPAASGDPYARPAPRRDPYARPPPDYYGTAARADPYREPDPYSRYPPSEREPPRGRPRAY